MSVSMSGGKINPIMVLDLGDHFKVVNRKGEEGIIGKLFPDDYVIAHNKRGDQLIVGKRRDNCPAWKIRDHYNSVPVDLRDILIFQFEEDLTQEATSSFSTRKGPLEKPHLVFA